MNSSDSVGPVLQNCEEAAAVIEAIRGMNPDVLVQDRGAYLRVLVPHRCVVTREAIGKALGRPFRLPGDLEVIMPSFKGELRLSEEDAVWSFRE